MPIDVSIYLSIIIFSVGLFALSLFLLSKRHTYIKFYENKFEIKSSVLLPKLTLDYSQIRYIKRISETMIMIDFIEKTKSFSIEKYSQNDKKKITEIISNKWPNPSGNENIE